ncbi:MAG: HAD-IIIC family phosphatase [Nitrospinae bacterium]|nr:HAD-IIIC family phosphatase [Nitrospinota bacterium]
MKNAAAGLDISGSWPEQAVKAVMEAAAAPSIGSVRRALKSVNELPAELAGPGFKLGIVRTYTVETQLDYIKLALSTCPCRPVIALGELDNIEQSLLDPASPMLQNSPDAVIVLWRLEELHPNLALEGHSWSPQARLAAAKQIIARIGNICAQYPKISSAPLFMSTFPYPARHINPVRDPHVHHGLSSVIMKINLELLEMASQNIHLHVLDIANLPARHIGSMYDDKMDLFARQPVADGLAAFSFAKHIKRVLRPLLYPPAKCLALDLDNTLWKGVLGEDGVEGLVIGHDFPGNVYRRIQHFAWSLKQQGILLALVTKNNHADVEEAFKRLDGMLLSLDDFAAVRANWAPKCENIREIAKELDIGLDSFVFLDDQEFERQEMKYMAPEVMVLEVSEDPLSIWRVLSECGYFDTYRGSEEDAKRHEDYANQRLRGQLLEKCGGVEDFLREMKMEAVIAPVDDSTLNRAAQMLSKTNQFNVTTKRHKAPDLAAMLSSKRNILLTISLKDRYGDQGIIGLAIAREVDAEQAVVDSFLLSCRALGRGAENALWSGLVENIAAKGYKKLAAEYAPTEKNAQVSGLFEKFGMTLTGEADGRKFYSLGLPAQVQYPDWIRIGEAVNA